MRDEEKRPTKLLHSADDLRQLILDNPDLPLLVFASEQNGDEITTRSGLFYEAVRIIKEMREATDGKYPTFAVWENVPGAFSSNKGEDFRAVLEALLSIGGECAVPRPPKGKWRKSGLVVADGYSLAWRQLDAQYWGVPQRTVTRLS